MLGYSREAVRVKVKKCEGKLQPELRKFSVDPQITSLEVLQSILTKAFDIKSDFTISYKTVDEYGDELHLPLLSDWDLDAAFLKAHNISLSQRCEPCVQLRVDMKPFAEATEDWEPSNIGSEQILSQSCRDPESTARQDVKQAAQMGFQGLIMNQVEKTFNMVSRALNLYEDPTLPPRTPLSDAEFRSFLDPVGQITHVPKLREVIYCGGIDPSLRKVVWKHILNVYPDGMTGRERMDYIKRKAAEYYSLRDVWKDCIQRGQVNEDLAYVTSMVRKDVLRTDRHHRFYAGSDDNQNIASLFNILTTYALNHPLVSYCQGMSDLASPLLVTMGDEAHAYVCLCALMQRLHPNFLLDGEAMTLKFTHLTEALQVYDPEFYAYLKLQQADDLLFCYRWLLLEMKREFAFEDALRMLEVLWASLPQKSVIKELCLKEKEFDPSISTEDGEPPPLSPMIKTRENAYTKVCSIRRQSSAFSLANVNANKMVAYRQMNHSLDENATRAVGSNASLKHAKVFQSLDDAVLRLPKQPGKDKIESRLIKKSAFRNEKLEKCDKQATNFLPENGKLLQPGDAKSLSSSTGNLVNGNILELEDEAELTPLGSQIRLLRDKISLHNNKFFSLDELTDGNTGDEEPNKPTARMIKNLNEFFNFAAGGKPPLTREKLMRTQSVVENSSPAENRPAIFLTKTSFDENELKTLCKGTKDHKLPRKINHLLDSEANDSSSPDDSQEYYPMTTSMTRELRLELEHLDRQVFGPLYVSRPVGAGDSASESLSTDDKPTNNDCDCQISKKETEMTEISESRLCIAEMSDLSKRPTPEIQVLNKATAKTIDNIFLWENPLHGNRPAARAVTSCPPTPDEQAELDFDGDTGEIFEESSGKKSITPIRLLRKNQPNEFKESSCKKHSSTHSSESINSETEVDVPPLHNLGELGESTTSKSHKFFSSMSLELENAKKSCETLLNPKQAANLQSVATTITNFQKKYEILKPAYTKTVSVTESSPASDAVKCTVGSLPPPHVFGGGNPFLMFLCLTVLLQHRDFIMRNRMDYNELAMHFDKMVRKHNVNGVLNEARQMYAMYLKQQACKISDINT